MYKALKAIIESARHVLRNIGIKNLKIRIQ